MKDNNLAKYLNIFVALIAAVAAFLFVRVFIADADAILENPEVQESVISPLVLFSTILLMGAIIITILLSIWSIIQNPQNLKKMGIGVGLLAVVLAISYSIADSDAVLDMQGVLIEGGDAGTATNHWVSTGIWFSMALGLVASLFFVYDLFKGLIKS